MRRHILDIKLNLRQPWLLSILLATCIPIFPEYFAPIFAGASLAAACFDAKIHGQIVQIGLLGKILLVYIAYMGIGILYSNRAMSTLSTFALWCVMFMLYLAMTTVLTNRHRLDTALFCVCVVAGAVGFIGVVQYSLGAAFGFTHKMELWRFIDKIVLGRLPITILETDIFDRSASTFNNPNIYAEYLIMALPFTIHYSFDGHRTRARVLCRCCFMLALLGTLLSFSRGSYLALLVILLVFSVANIRKILIIAMGIVSASLLVPDQVISRMFSVSRADHSISERMMIWSIGVDKFRDSPIFGMGAGVSNSWDALIAGGVDAPHMHNIVIQLLVEGGIISFGIMCAIGLTLLRYAYRLFKNNRAVGTALLAFVLAFCTYSMVDFPLLTPKLIGMFVLVIALGEVMARIYLARETTPISLLLPKFSPAELETGEVVFLSENPHNK